jgi:polyribonucleotide nucleotidyltransferase
MDIKIEGLSREILEQALAQARDGRLHILGKMLEALPAPRTELSKYAPRITTLKVKPDQIRLVIGPGGKTIKGIVEQTGVADRRRGRRHGQHRQRTIPPRRSAIDIIRGLTMEAEVGKIYKGIVKRVERLRRVPRDHAGHRRPISDFAWERVERTEDVMNLGDEVEVMVTNIDGEGRVRLSSPQGDPAVVVKPEGYVEPPPREGGGGGGEGGGGGGGGGES